MYIYTHINKYIFKTKVLKDPEEIRLGMMGKKFDRFDAALFVMDQPESSFWMKNCIIPLDVVFVHNGTITKIYHSCPPCKKFPCENYLGKGEFVLELEGGTCKKLKIKPKDKVSFI
jgi:uncharacterized membrane protein (UPF0127 family)